MSGIFHYTLLSSFLLLNPLCMRLLTERVNNRIYEKIGYWFSVIVLMFLSAFRADTVGNDTHEYLYVRID